MYGSKCVDLMFKKGKMYIFVNKVLFKWRAFYLFILRIKWRAI